MKSITSLFNNKQKDNNGSNSENNNYLKAIDNDILNNKFFCCPKCKKKISISLNPANFSLSYNCQNAHKESNISYNFFYKEKKYTNNIPDIFCQQCKNQKLEHNKILSCTTCHFQLCLDCIMKHKNIYSHNSYGISDNSINKCQKHKIDISHYCKTCKENLCVFCLKNNGNNNNNHNEHEIINFSELMPDLKEIENNKKVLQKKILKNNSIIDKLNSWKKEMCSLIDEITKNLRSDIMINKILIQNFNWKYLDYINYINYKDAVKNLEITNEELEKFMNSKMFIEQTTALTNYLFGKNNDLNKCYNNYNSIIKINNNNVNNSKKNIFSIININNKNDKEEEENKENKNNINNINNINNKINVNNFNNINNNDMSNNHIINNNNDINNINNNSNHNNNIFSEDNDNDKEELNINILDILSKGNILLCNNNKIYSYSLNNNEYKKDLEHTIELSSEINPSIINISSEIFIDNNKKIYNNLINLIKYLSENIDNFNIFIWKMENNLQKDKLFNFINNENKKIINNSNEINKNDEKNEIKNEQKSKTDIKKEENKENEIKNNENQEQNKEKKEEINKNNDIINKLGNVLNNINNLYNNNDGVDLINPNNNENDNQRTGLIIQNNNDNNSGRIPNNNDNNNGGMELYFSNNNNNANNNIENNVNHDSNRDLLFNNNNYNIFGNYNNNYNNNYTSNLFSNFTNENIYINNKYNGFSNLFGFNNFNRNEEVKKEEEEEYVYISATGHKYHGRAQCGWMKSSTKVTISKAEAMGLNPCRKCY